MKAACALEKAVFAKKLPYKEVAKNTISNKKRELEIAFNEKKRQLIKELFDRKESLRLEEEQKQADAAEAAREIRLKNEKSKAEGGLNNYTDGFDPANREAFDNLKKRIESYLLHLYGARDYKKVLQQKPDGALPAADISLVFELVKDIVDNISVKKNIENWLKPNKKNKSTRAKIAEWVGREKMEELFNQLKG